MNPVQKALWYVESHLQESISLEEIAGACHVSTYHLTRAFAANMGLSLMRYVRGRRLSEAARRLAAGASDILVVALDTGYGSHEAFTRAFREHFECTPEQLRARGNLIQLQLTEAILMNSTTPFDLAPPRIETLKPMLLAGLVERYNCQSPAGIPGQWQRFNSSVGHIPGRLDRVAYGVSYNFDRESNFDYLCGVEIAGSSDLPGGVTTLQVPANKYVVFAIQSHIANIRAAFSAIWSQWLPQSGHEPINAPTLERYGPEFNPLTGMGGYELWIAVKS